MGVDPFPERRFAVRVSRRGCSDRVRVEGALDLVTAGRLEALLKRELTPRGEAVLDLSRVDFLDAAGVHAVLRALEVARARGTTLSLSPRLPRQVGRLLQLVGVLETFPPADAALAELDWRHETRARRRLLPRAAVVPRPRAAAGRRGP